MLEGLVDVQPLSGDGGSAYLAGARGCKYSVLDDCQVSPDSQHVATRVANSKHLDDDSELEVGDIRCGG